jgi:Family of unknown function (DUF6790)
MSLDVEIPMETVIRFLLQNFTLTFLVVGLVASPVSLWTVPRPWTAPMAVEALFSYFILFSIALTDLYNFVAHVFFGQMTARFIGWADSPFQTEVGFASLGFAAVGFLAFRGSFDMRTAAVLAPACFLLGAAATHFGDMFKTHNLAPGNAGVIFYTDMLRPVIGFTLLWLQRRYSRQRLTPAKHHGERGALRDPGPTRPGADAHDRAADAQS